MKHTMPNRLECSRAGWTRHPSACGHTDRKPEDQAQRLPGATQTRRTLSVVIGIGLGLFSATAGLAKGTNTIVVSQDGSGQFRSIQAALDGIQNADTSRWVVFIRNGVYAEKVFLMRSNVTLIGEHQDSTCIIFPELRSEWRRTHDSSDWGAGVVNIDSSASDIVIANLTIRNNYGAIHGSRDHQFAIRGGGTRIILYACNVLSEGGDTVSLWNRDNGMYYHAACTFEGWVDYVCPRGWCYITESRFYGHSMTASIWHDGSRDPDQKLVITRSFFDGVSGFALGRHHRDAQFFLVDCRFSVALADTPIYRPATSPAPNLWGERCYYHNCSRDGGDYSWFADNLSRAPGAPPAAAITARWTFRGMWDPEEEIRTRLPSSLLTRCQRGSMKSETVNRRRTANGH